MVPLRLRCVMTLTAVTLLALCETDKVTARASDAAKPQTQGFDSLAISNQLRSRRRWPVRLLLSGRTSSIVSAFTHSSVGKKLLFSDLRFKKKQKIVTDLFKSHDVKSANAQKNFRSHQYKSWEAEVKAKYGERSEELMLSTMYEQYNARDNGGVEAIIAQAIKVSDTQALGLRFKDLLLKKLGPGVKKALISRKKKVDMTAVWTYMRNSSYRDSEEMSVHQKMIQEVHDPYFPERIHLYKETLKKESATSFKHLDHTFETISGGRKVVDVFKELQGFNNNAYLLHKLYEEANDRTIDVNPVEYMLTRLHTARWSNDEIANHLLPIRKQDFSPDLRDKLLDPMLDKLASLLPSRLDLQRIHEDLPPT